MTYFVSTYTYTSDTRTRSALRPEHQQWLRSLGDTNVLSGPTDAATGVLVLDAADAAALERLLDHDPFHTAGVIASRSIVQWAPMTGRLIDSLGKDGAGAPEAGATTTAPPR